MIVRDGTCIPRHCPCQRKYPPTTAGDVVDKEVDLAMLLGRHDQAAKRLQEAASLVRAAAAHLERQRLHKKSSARPPAADNADAAGGAPIERPGHPRQQTGRRCGRVLIGDGQHIKARGVLQHAVQQHRRRQQQDARVLLVALKLDGGEGRGRGRLDGNITV